MGKPWPSFLSKLENRFSHLFSSRLSSPATLMMKASLLEGGNPCHYQLLSSGRVQKAAEGRGIGQTITALLAQSSEQLRSYLNSPLTQSLLLLPPPLANREAMAEKNLPSFLPLPLPAPSSSIFRLLYSVLWSSSIFSHTCHFLTKSPLPSFTSLNSWILLTNQYTLISSFPSG